MVTIIAGLIDGWQIIGALASVKALTTRSETLTDHIKTQPENN